MESPIPFCRSTNEAQYPSDTHIMARSSVPTPRPRKKTRGNTLQWKPFEYHSSNPVKVSSVNKVLEEERTSKRAKVDPPDQPTRKRKPAQDQRGKKTSVSSVVRVQTQKHPNRTPQGWVRRRGKSLYYFRCGDNGLTTINKGITPSGIG